MCKKKKCKCPLNFKYFLTKQSSYKLLSVICGAVAVYLITDAYTKGKYFYKCTPRENLTYLQTWNNKTFMKNLTRSYNTTLQKLKVMQPTSCEHLHKGTPDYCQPTLSKFEDLFKERVQNSEFLFDRINESEQYQDILEGLDEFPKTCAPPWLVTVPVYLIWPACVISGILYLPFPFVNLHKLRHEFVVGDFSWNFCAFSMFMLSTLFLSAFIITAELSKYPCTQKIYDKGLAGIFAYGPPDDKMGMVGGKPTSRVSEFGIELMGGSRTEGQEGGEEGTEGGGKDSGGGDSSNSSSKRPPKFGPGGRGLFDPFQFMSKKPNPISRMLQPNATKNDPTFPNCEKEKDYVYKTWFLVGGTAASGLATFFHVLVVNSVNRDGCMGAMMLVGTLMSMSTMIYMMYRELVR